MADNPIMKHLSYNDMSEDESKSSDGKPIRVSGDLKKALFASEKHTSDSSDKEE